MAKILMISLDKNILDANSRVADRMRKYGQHDEIFIIIPAKDKKTLDLSETVRVFSTGGNKLIQFFRLKILGQKILKENKIDLITTQDPFFIGWVGVMIKKASRVLLEVQIHGDFFGSDYYNGLKLVLGRWVLRQADRVRVVGERIKKSLVDLDIEENKIKTQSIQVNADEIQKYQFKFNLHERYPGYEKIFLVLGRLDPVKNIKWLVNIFKEVVLRKSNWLLLIVGNGKEETNIKLQITSYRLQKNIKFENWASDSLSYLKTADCLLFPSLSEGYGLVAMEAYYAGTPVIMTDVGVANYELKPGPKVKIVSVGDKEKFIQAILGI